MSRRIKVRGDLVLAQSLETVFEKANGRDVSFLKKLGLITQLSHFFILAGFGIYKK